MNLAPKIRTADARLQGLQVAIRHSIQRQHQP
jgi:hypothetical protein